MEDTGVEVSSLVNQRSLLGAPGASGIGARWAAPGTGLVLPFLRSLRVGVAYADGSNGERSEPGAPSARNAQGCAFREKHVRFVKWGQDANR